MAKLKVVQIMYKTTIASPEKRLHEAFMKAGIDSRIISLITDLHKNNRITKIGGKGRRIAMIDSKLQSYLTKDVNSRLGSFSYPVWGTDLSRRKEVQEADVIYVHWVLNGFMSLKNLEQLAKLGKPVVFYMHDTWYITGGCHYTLECEKFKIACGECPMLKNSKKNDLAAKGFKKKKKFFSSYDNLYFVAPSRWLYQCAKESALTGDKPLFHIPNTLAKDVFKPYDKKVAKEIVNFKEDEIVIAFGAIAVNSPYKGWEYLQKALELLYHRENRLNIKVLIFGSGYNEEIANAIPFKTEFAGFLTSDYATSLMYNAADVFVAPSLADNLPYTVFEALSCGTPVAAFSIGGIPEFIDHKVNGYLAEYKNAEDLAEGIRFCVENKIKGQRLPSFEPEVVLQQYQEFMEAILAQKA